MRHWIRQLASLKLTVFLLVFIVLVLAAGTIVEARFGTSTARAIYYAPWFLGLQVAFGLNLLCSLVDRWPWDRQRIGFALTHGSLLVILLGASVTALVKQEGQLTLWEGEASDQFIDALTPGEINRYSLPFSIRLQDFEVDYYPGTRRPAQYRSHVQVEDSARAVSFSATIQMNRELVYGGYRFFQSSYRQDGGREATVLSVSRDWGQPVVFAGYVLLLAGMVTVLSTRLGQRRRPAEEGLEPSSQHAHGSKDPFKVVGVILLVLVLTAGASRATDEPPTTISDTEAVEALRDLPVQHDGRAMPLDTLAREATWRVTGKRTWRGIDPVELVLSWCFDPEAWSRVAMIPMESSGLATAIGLPVETRYVSFAEAASKPRLASLWREARQKSLLDEPVEGILAEAQRLEDRLRWLQRFLRNDALLVVPASRAGGRWSAVPEVAAVGDLVALEARLSASAPAHYPSAGQRSLEVRYNRTRPTRVSWVILLLALALALAALFRPRPAVDLLTGTALMTAFGIMTWGLVTRWLIAGRIPASNMYESMLFLGWGVGLFGVIASIAIRNRLLVLNAAAMSTLCMILLDLLPMDPFIHPMPPVLTGTPWLAIHVPITMVSYSVFAIGVLVAHLQIGLDMFAPSRRDLVAKLNDLLYWYMHIGSILLAAGIFTGSIWAASSWGRYWGWDPKEVWSLIALLAYMAILHGRFDRILGEFGTAALSILAFWTILMTYLGVNFILSAGLHSYGFGESPVANWLVLSAAIELLFLLTAAVIHARRPAPLPIH